MGIKKSDIESEVKEELVIPICKECSESLHDNKWVLIYCYRCTKNQWVYKPLSRIPYKKNQHIIWIDGCPKCSKKTKRVVHSDEW